MSTAATAEAPPFHRPAISHENLLFDYPEADVILRSRDSYEFRVLKIYIVHNSSILGEKVLISPDPQPEPTSSTIPADSDVDSGPALNALPVVRLPIEGAILFSLLTYIFPVSPVLPSTVEQVMGLLSVAQSYKMDVTLTHIRSHIAQQEPPFIREETAFLIYSLSQKHGLRTEALQAARCTLNFATLNIQHLAEEKRLDIIPGAFLLELWKYHKRVRLNLKSDLRVFIKSNVLTIFEDSSCESLTSSGIPSWLGSYISNIGNSYAPGFLDPTDFHMELVEHSQKSILNGGCASCSGISREKIREIWGALTAVVHNSISKTESDFKFVIHGTSSEGQAISTGEATSRQKYSDMPNADIILWSSDLVDFHVHKSALVASSPVFRDMFSLPQPPNDAPEALPEVYLSERADTLNSLISFLYPVAPEIPDYGDDILTLLAAATKYDMDAVQHSIRAGVSRKKLISGGVFHHFHVYAVAYSKALIPETAIAARNTLGYPLTFESLGDSLRSFEGGALRDLADFRLRSIDNFSSNLNSFSCRAIGPSKIWVGCPTAKGGKNASNLPTWLEFLHSGPIQARKFSETIPTSAQLCDRYMKALQSHVKEKDCNFCMKVHTLEGEKYCENLREISTQGLAWNVPAPTLGERPGAPRTV